jgi:hypothetical protein
MTPQIIHALQNGEAYYAPTNLGFALIFPVEKPTPGDLATAPRDPPLTLTPKGPLERAVQAQTRRRGFTVVGDAS